MSQCEWDKPWDGRCKNDAIRGGRFCTNHAAQQCSSCGKIAIRGCEAIHSGQICNAPLCHKCEHELDEQGLHIQERKHTNNQKYFSWLYQSFYKTVKR